jgi:hypothetical protein
MVDNEPGVTITIKELYLEMKQLISEVRMLTQEYKNAIRVDEDHERRLRTLERWMYAIPASMIIAVIGAVVAIMGG